MEKTEYKSIWDASTWWLIAFCEACVVWSVFIDVWIGLAATALVTAVLLVTFLGVKYEVVGDELWVYSLFMPKKYPIGKIAEINRSSSILSAPATSLKHRLAIKFTDKSVMKSFLPLLISPVRQEEFVKQLQSINPNIKINI